jgi:hypothetical protein
MAQIEKNRRKKIAPVAAGSSGGTPHADALHGRLDGPGPAQLPKRAEIV